MKGGEVFYSEVPRIQNAAKSVVDDELNERLVNVLKSISCNFKSFDSSKHKQRMDIIKASIDENFVKESRKKKKY